MEEKLKELIDKEFIYQGKKITIKKVKKINASFVVITDKRTFNFYEAEAHKFIQDLEIINPIKPTIKMDQNVKPTEEIQVKSQEGVRQVLLDTLAKVKNDKAYIPQANAICNIASQLINIQKLELQMLAQSKK